MEMTELEDVNSQLSGMRNMSNVQKAKKTVFTKFPICSTNTGFFCSCRCCCKTPKTKI